MKRERERDRRCTGRTTRGFCSKYVSAVDSEAKTNSLCQLRTNHDRWSGVKGVGHYERRTIHQCKLMVTQQKMTALDH